MGSGIGARQDRWSQFSDSARVFSQPRWCGGVEWRGGAENPMTLSSSRLAFALIVLVAADVAGAQTADEIIERSVTALGGRAAHAKLKSRSMTGTIVLSTPAGEVKGSIEILNAAPNKMRMLIKADLSALGVGQLVLDQRFDGSSGYALDTLQGNREITGNQLDNMRNSSFPHPFLTYKELGTTARLTGKEKVGERDAYLVVFEPTSGSTIRQFIDAETHMPIKMVMNIEIPQLGQEVEQTTEFLDFRDVDGVKLPFRLLSSSSVQNFTINLDRVEHNVEVDQTLFVKPAAQ
jgi:outer membrane lipoprotein-sorting protein